MRNKRVLVILCMFSLVFCCVGGTLSYLSWETDEDQKIVVGGGLTEHFECAVTSDNGREVSSGDVLLAPALCTSEKNAIKRELNTTVNIFGYIDVNLDLWLEINEMDDVLRNTTNFRYAVTTDENSCTNGVVVSGTFYGKEDGSTIELLKRKIYTATINETYYLYIWLDAAETSLETANKSFDFTLNGSCTDDPTVPDTYTYTISYNTNGGEGYIDSQGKTPRTEITLTSEEPTREGYAFIGWNTASDGSGTTYQSGDVYNMDASLTLYAMWGEIYTICYDANGGSGAPGCQEKVETQVLTISSTEPTRTDYSFKGWATSADSTVVSYYASGTYSEDASATLYAVWEENASVYTISYDANGGSGAPSSQEKTHDVDITLSTTKPTREGYTFTGWNTTSDGSGASYASGATYTGNVALTLYAQWQANTYTISYDANGGSGAPSSQEKTHDVGITLSTTKPTREGYTFTGWNTTSDGSGENYASGATYTGNVALTLYAQWQANTYTISYEANIFSTTSQTVNGVTISYDYDTSYLTLDGTQTATINLMELMDQTFVSGEQYKMELTYVSGNVTVNATSSIGLEAKKENSAFVSTRNYISLQFPTSGTNSTILTFNDSAESEGKMLHNWIYVSESGALVYDNYVVKVVITKVQSELVEYGYDYNLPVNPTRIGYTFAGWYTAESGGTLVTSSTRMDATSDHTLYAQWTLNKLTINYNVNGGTITETTTSTGGTVYSWSTETDGTIKLNGSVRNHVTSYGSNVNLGNYNNSNYINITKTGSIGVDGAEWICLSGCTTANKTFDHDASIATTEFCDVASGDCTVELGVNWTPITYTVSYNANGGSGAPASQTKTYGVTLTLSSVKPTRSGYTFLGWSTSKTATSATYAAGGSYTSNASATLYAVWKTAEPVAATVNGQNSSMSYFELNDYSTAITYAGGGPDHYYYAYVLKFTTPSFSFTPSAITININMKANSLTAISLRYALLSSDANLPNYGRTGAAVSDANQIYAGTWVNANVSTSYTNYPFTIETSNLSPSKTYYFMLWAYTDYYQNVAKVNSTDNHSVLIS